MKRILINTQSPPIRFINYKGPSSAQVDLNFFSPDIDYVISTGGVVRMVLPFLESLINQNYFDEAYWVSLNVNAPEKVSMGKIFLNHVMIPEQVLKNYGLIKEELWKFFHKLEKKEKIIENIWREEFADFIYYNRIVAERIFELDKKLDFDIFYIHDFQQLNIGYMLSSLKPKLFRWHIPFLEEILPQEWRTNLSIYLNSYDGIIVSTKNYLENLKTLGYNGKSFVSYPYIDPKIYKKPEEDIIKEFCSKYDIKYEEKVILCIARLDYAKNQPILVKALKEISKSVDAKVIFVGNGSFSSSKQGLGLSKADLVRSMIMELANELDLKEKVVITGYLDQKMLNAAYTRADLFVLPSILEGFGLVVVEAWLFKKPVIVSKNAGISELIREGENGYTINPYDYNEIAEKAIELLTNEEKAKRLGEEGYKTARLCTIEEGLKKEIDIISLFL